MKKYKINIAEKVNSRSAKSGIKWRYHGKAENFEETIAIYKKYNGSRFAGVRVTDTETGAVVYEELIN